MQKAGLSHPFHGWSMTGDKALGREEQRQDWSSHLGTGREAAFAGGKGAAPRVLETRVPAGPQLSHVKYRLGDVLLPSVTQLNSKEPMIPVSSSEGRS